MFAVIDTETTHINPTWARIIDVAVIHLNDDLTINRTWQTLIHPNTKSIPADATAVHGITIDDLTGAPLFHEIAPELTRQLTGHLIVGFNIKFDLRIIEKEYERAAAEFYCPLFLDLQQAGAGTLTDLCEELNTPTRPSRRAITDATATAEVLHRIGATQIDAPTGYREYRISGRMELTADEADLLNTLTAEEIIALNPPAITPRKAELIAGHHWIEGKQAAPRGTGRKGIQNLINAYHAAASTPPEAPTPAAPQTGPAPSPPPAAPRRRLWRRRP